MHDRPTPLVRVASDKHEGGYYEADALPKGGKQYDGPSVEEQRAKKAADEAEAAKKAAETPAT